jgi:hypothetical protein
MGNFGFLAGMGAAKKASASTLGKSADRRRHVIAIVIAIPLALLIGAGLILLLSTGH